MRDSKYRNVLVEGFDEGILATLLCSKVSNWGDRGCGTIAAVRERGEIIKRNGYSNNRNK